MVAEDRSGTGSLRRIRLLARGSRSDPLARSSLLMMSTTIINSAIGYVFWVVTAHSFSPAAVGSVGALISAATIAATLSDLGLRTMLMQQLPVERDRIEWSRRVSGALLLALGSAAIFGIGAALLSPLLSTQLTSYVTPTARAAVVTVTVFLTVYTMLDGISVAEHRAGQIVVRNIINGFTKVVAVVLLIVVLRGTDLVALYATAVAFVVAACYGVFRHIRAVRPDWRFALTGTATALHDVRGRLIGHHLLNLGGWLPTFVLPLEVVALASTEQNAYSTLTWMLGNAFFTVSPSVSSALFVAGRWKPDELRSATRRAATLIAALMIPAGLTVAVFGHWILGIFGRDYAHYGYPLLLVLVASAIPDAITNVRIGRLRAQGRVSDGARMNLGMAAISIGLAWVLIPPMGIVGIGVAWLAAQTAGSIYGFAEDAVVRRRNGYRGRHRVMAGGHK